MDKDQPAESSEEIDKVEDVSEEKAAETVVEGEVVSNGEDSPEALTKLLEDARSKADDHWDQLMRTRAEMDNLRKRQERDLENAHKFALDKFSQDLLQVWDSLELGHQAAQEESADVEKLREGTELTLRLLSSVMEKNGVEQVDPTGETFNPEFHQAMSMQERDDVEPNTVVAVVQKGYRLNGRLIRPAMVMVSKAPSAPVDEQA
ncbi:MAG: nucleotide exchange factor GrpE [endosymbiont of Escarpia spicata]|uniref:Protein GrpE n=1 Tax=endosymbiont of Escarpia spicata TaxID=2200908 RepID=A0A370DHD3_9GAMM|nr:MAG: nucleotide exchange factor GrpE [endosymbiont of Escarpia spicata]